MKELTGKTIAKVEVEHGQFTKEVYEARGLEPVVTKHDSRTIRLVFTDGTSYEFPCSSERVQIVN